LALVEEIKEHSKVIGSPISKSSRPFVKSALKDFDRSIGPLQNNVLTNNKNVVKDTN
jgi:hypothetical protein